MLDRMAVGRMPDKPHTALRDATGELLYEHCITRDAFDGPYTIAYREGRPQAQRPIASPVTPLPLEVTMRGRLHRRHFRAFGLAFPEGASVASTVPLLMNRDVIVSVAAPTEPDPYYVSHADGDVLYFVLEGSGTLRSELGDLPFEPLDYVFVPKGLIHRFVFTGPQRWLGIECARKLGLLKKHRNRLGQLRMDAPYSHRDFRRPSFVGPVDEGLRELVVLRRAGAQGFRYERSPLDVVGWDGTVYPWAFPIERFSPRVGEVHLPPDVHGTFEARHVLISSFVPRPLDFHPDAVPCPYPHSSVDCDEVIFYASGDFTSRTGVGVGSVSLHPAGIAHGPHPGAYEASPGKERTEEVAVMLDLFRPVRPTAYSDAVEDEGYHLGFMGGASRDATSSSGSD
jgi:homogentisate 1,2-dioxygenase